jgi:hypothetical protein
MIEARNCFWWGFLSLAQLTPRQHCLVVAQVVSRHVQMSEAAVKDAVATGLAVITDAADRGEQPLDVPWPIARNPSRAV